MISEYEFTVKQYFSHLEEDLERLKTASKAFENDLEELLFYVFQVSDLVSSLIRGADVITYLEAANDDLKEALRKYPYH